MRDSKKCVVVLSGGLDSAVVAYWAKAQGYQIYPLTFNYGQIALKETLAAQKIAQALNTTTKVIDLSALRDIYGGASSLVSRDIPLTSEFSDSIIVPFRNAIFLSAAVAYAITVGADQVFYGAQGSDEACYADCRREFYEAFEKAAQLGTERKISIEAPFSNKLKSEVIEEGRKLGVPFEFTWSCYLDGAIHCGKCEACVNRRKAFTATGTADPTKYRTSTE
ncbi:7-cyano-7-deazaguanine synthase QueC [Candidatus Bathycorpusculum sp.]|uniref:7-cyano-7-deazaguanine synthase QueC n=1 Tax=Candidatus Bathycorpusculum sp. TaxID=2994959 RepID=UPI0028258D88|nr:7-cyano-7-deazaguanine synthase QueC [Candidatus Termitimicrobium sp.]MCL2685382.1 7-cyano-7-deazaguanine synthase QueC [Candidatus Termitimicrobium sp.]